MFWLHRFYNAKLYLSKIKYIEALKGRSVCVREISEWRPQASTRLSFLRVVGREHLEAPPSLQLRLLSLILVIHESYSVLLPAKEIMCCGCRARWFKLKRNQKFGPYHLASVDLGDAIQAGEGKLLPRVMVVMNPACYGISTSGKVSHGLIVVWMLQV